MNRCTKFLATLLLATPLLAATTLASAQGVGRMAPKDVKHGQLVVTAPPDITMDGKPDRLSPGSRIRGTNFMLLMSGSIVGQSMPVVYKRDAAGMVHEVWVLTPEEDAKLGGDADSAQGYKRFAELLDLIFGARR